MKKRRKNNMVRHQRRIKYRQQNGRCFVCGAPVWEYTIEALEAFMERTNVSKRRARRKLKCTLDHYIPKAQGGKDNDQRNHVLCKACNHARDQEPFEAFLQRSQ